MKPLYGFFQDEKWYEDLGHVFLELFLPGAGWVREHFQWPPGHVVMPFYEHEGDALPLDRVADAYRDFLGYAIGDVLRTAVLVGLLVWRW